MKAFLIEPEKSVVRQIRYNGDLEGIFEQVEAQLERHVLDTRSINALGDVICVAAFDDSDEPDVAQQEVKPPFFIQVAGQWYKSQKGISLIIGTNRKGEAATPKISLEDIRSRVVFSDSPGITSQEEHKIFSYDDLEIAYIYDDIRRPAAF